MKPTMHSILAVADDEHVHPEYKVDGRVRSTKAKGHPAY